MRKNKDQKKSEYRHFSRSDGAPDNLAKVRAMTLFRWYSRMNLTSHYQSYQSHYQIRWNIRSDSNWLSSCCYCSWHAQRQILWRFFSMVFTKIWSVKKYWNKCFAVSVNSFFQSHKKLRNSSLQMFFKINVLKNVTNFTGEYLYWSFFLTKLRAEHLRRLLLKVYFLQNHNNIDNSIVVPCYWPRHYLFITYQFQDVLMEKR